MAVVAFDIETIANRAFLKTLPPAEPAIGNLKDPEKIKAKIEAATVARIADAGKNKFENLVCVFSWCDGHTADGILLKEESEAAEKQLLEQVWEILNKYDHFITFNGINFDVPVLNLHSLFRRVRPSVNISTQKYRIANHTDLRAVFTGWEKYEPGTLDFFLRACLGKTKPEDISGALVQDYWDIGLSDEVLKYGVQDARDTWDLWQYAREYYPGLY